MTDRDRYQDDQRGHALERRGSQGADRAGASDMSQTEQDAAKMDQAAQAGVAGAFGVAPDAEATRERLRQDAEQSIGAGPSAGAAGAEARRESGQPGGGAGRVDEVGKSGVYPASGPLPSGDAEIRAPASWGQGKRGAAGSADSGTSEAAQVGDEPGIAGLSETDAARQAARPDGDAHSDAEKA